MTGWPASPPNVSNSADVAGPESPEMPEVPVPAITIMSPAGVEGSKSQKQGLVVVVLVVVAVGEIEVELKVVEDRVKEAVAVIVIDLVNVFDFVGVTERVWEVDLRGTVEVEVGTVTVGATVVDLTPDVVELPFTVPLIDDVEVPTKHNPAPLQLPLVPLVTQLVPIAKNSYPHTNPTPQVDFVQLFPGTGQSALVTHVKLEEVVLERLGGIVPSEVTVVVEEITVELVP